MGATVGGASVAVGACCAAPGKAQPMAAASSDNASRQ